MEYQIPHNPEILDSTVWKRSNQIVESEDDQDEYIFGPPLDILSRVEAIEYMHNALQSAQH
jgi:hypothetical protein